MPDERTPGQPPHTSMLICTLPRSGSWLLAEGLWRTGLAGRPEEYFRPDWFERFRQIGKLPFQHRLHRLDHWEPPDLTGASAPGQSRRSFGRFLAEIQRIGTTPNGVFGLKCHWGQLWQVTPQLRRVPARCPASPADLLGGRFRGARHVRLVRRDKLRQAISLHRASTTNIWSSSDDPRHRAAGRDPGYDQDRIEGLLEQLRRWEMAWDRYFETCGASPLVVTYEELTSDYHTTVTRVLRHIGVRSPIAAIPSPRLRKLGDAFTEAWASRYAAETASRATAWPAARKGEAPMRSSVIIVDNFYANPTAVREYALKQRYYYPYQPEADVRSGRRRVTWMSTRFKPASECPFKSSLELIGALEYLTGDCIDLDQWNFPFPVDREGKPRPGYRRQATSCLWNCCFHFKPDTGQELGEGVHNHVVDSWNAVGEDGWAGLLYLAPDAPLRGGLKLWRNVDPAHNYDWMTPKENWELIDDLGNVPNRLLLCRGSIPHSGARGWGASLTDGRLYQTFFFRVRPPVPRDGVLAPV